MENLTSKPDEIAIVCKDCNNESTGDLRLPQGWRREDSAEKLISGSPARIEYLCPACSNNRRRRTNHIFVIGCCLDGDEIRELYERIRSRLGLRDNCFLNYEDDGQEAAEIVVEVDEIDKAVCVARAIAGLQEKGVRVLIEPDTPEECSMVRPDAQNDSAGCLTWLRVERRTTDDTLPMP